MSRVVDRIKAGIIGDPQVGKTHFLYAYLYGSLENKPILPTVALEFHERIVKVDDREVALKVWDTSGCELYRKIIPFHLKECDIIILMYDITDTSSIHQNIQHSPHWSTSSPASRNKASISKPKKYLSSATNST